VALFLGVHLAKFSAYADDRADDRYRGKADYGNPEDYVPHAATPRK
jgi:hypothetical protein